nr:MBL fold metallo-hydrolase [Metabacillus mangrovi]
MEAIGNAGFIDLGEETLVFDTLSLPQAAAVLRTEAEERTGNRVKYTVNSHYHSDHTNGNQIFKDTVIISTAKTKAEMAGSLISESAPVQGLDLMDLAVGIMEETLPTLLIEDKLVLEGKTRSAELYHFGCAHSCSDLFLYLPVEKILFAGDLVLADRHAWMGCGRPEEWITVLDRMAPFKIEAIVPGHGPVGGPETIQKTQDYIRELMDHVMNLKIKGRTPDEILAAPMPKKLSGLARHSVYERNVRFLFEYAESGVLGCRLPV